MITIDDLKNLCYNTGRKLVKMQVEDENIKDDTNLTSKLIYPKYGELSSNEGKKRISEQEARLLFVQCLEEYYKEIFYSIETPTDYRYDFTDKKKVYKEKVPKTNKGHEGQSALSDLSLFARRDGLIKQDVNIEFKSHNPDEESITKDILKLIAEPYDGLFFHVLTEIENKSLLHFNRHSKSSDFEMYKNENIIKKKSEGGLAEKGVIDKIIAGFAEYFNLAKNNWTDSSIEKEKEILIAIVILPFDLLIMKEVDREILENNSLLDIFKFSYDTDRPKSGNKKFEVIKAGINNWELINLKDADPMYELI